MIQLPDDINDELRALLITIVNQVEAVEADNSLLHNQIAILERKVDDLENKKVS